MAPLSALASPKSKWKWEKEHDKAFKEAKDMIKREALLAYPDFNKEFHIYADASDYQLGGVIMQNNKPLAFYTRKLNNAQAKYTTAEQELLSIVEMLKAYQNILIGQKIIVHTNHKNLVYKTFNTKCVIHWLLLIKEFGPKLLYIKGEENIVAVTAPRL